MTDKVQKIHEKVEKLKSNLIYGACSSQIAIETRCKEEAYNEVLAILDTMQKEPVSNVWHDMSEEAENGRNIIIIDPKDFYGAVLRKGGSQLKNHNKERYVKWAYIDDIINFTNKEEPVSEDFEMALTEMIDKAQKCVVEPWVVAAQWKDELVKLAKGKKPVSKKFAFKAIPRLLEMIEPTDRAKAYTAKLADTLEVEGYSTDAKIVKESLKIMNGEKVPMATMDEEAVSEDLGEYINELHKQFQEVSFAKLSRIAVRVAKWQKEKDFQYIKKECERTTSCCDDNIAIEAQRRHPYYYTSDIEAYANIGFKEGATWQKEQMMAKAVEVTVHVDAGNYPYIPQIELYDYNKDVPLAKDGDKYKIILIKEE